MLALGIAAALASGACGRGSDLTPAQRTRTSPGQPAYRPGEGRLAGVGWADAAAAGDARSRAAVSRRARRLVEEADGSRTVASLRADAVSSLLAGRVDNAIARLSRATELAPRDAILWSDLAAARLQRGVKKTDPYDFVLALAAARRACELAPALPEARFNRALAMQRLSLYDRAGAEWSFYLTVEPDPRWARAAETHRAALLRAGRRPHLKARLAAAERAVERGRKEEVRALVASSPQLFREHVEGKLLAAWAEAEGRQREAEAQRLLATARVIGGALLATNGERMVADTVSQIDRLRATASPALARLTQAFRAYDRGVSLADGGDFAGARQSFETAHRLFAALESPFADWATYWIATCNYQHSEYASALALLRPLTDDRHRSRYAALHARALALEGLIEILEGNPVAALAAYQSSLADYRGLGESANAGRMTSMVASCLDYLGRRSEAWRQIHAALVEPATLDTPAVREVICVVAAWLATEDGEREIALWFQDEVVRNALANGAPYRIVTALRGRGEILAARGAVAPAARDVVEARRYLEEVADPETRRTLAADLKLVEAQLVDSPQEAIELFDDVIRIFRASNYHYRLAQALYARARVRQALGQSDAVERDLAAAIAEFELQRERIPVPEERISYFDRMREILDAMVRLHLERGRPDLGFRYGDEAKARALLDWILAQPTGEALPARADKKEPASEPASLRRDLSSGTTLIDYWVLPDRLVIWVLRRDRFAVEIVAVGAATLDKLAGRLARGPAKDRRADVVRSSTQLYDYLIRPVAHHLGTADRIVVVPDRALHNVPFALLRDRRSGRYLVQDHACSTAPSARVFVASQRRSDELSELRNPRVLAVVDPAFDRQLFRSLPRLKGALAEAAIAQLFPGSRVLSGPNATTDAFLKVAGDFEVLHFGGHALVNAEYPLLSQMLFASHRGDRTRGVLYSGNLLGRRFQRTRLVVLASCRAAAGRISHTEGVQSLSRPFLAAGVPAVVASFWDVDDAATADFFLRFYGHLQQGFDPVAALQRTQLELLQARPADPLVWAAFVLIGAGAPAA